MKNKPELTGNRVFQCLKLKINIDWRGYPSETTPSAVPA